jgi:hypothetical protein
LQRATQTRSISQSSRRLQPRPGAGGGSPKLIVSARALIGVVGPPFGKTLTPGLGDKCDAHHTSAPDSMHGSRAHGGPRRQPGRDSIPEGPTDDAVSAARDEWFGAAVPPPVPPRDSPDSWDTWAEAVGISAALARPARIPSPTTTKGPNGARIKRRRASLSETHACCSIEGRHRSISWGFKMDQSSPGQSEVLAFARSESRKKGAQRSTKPGKLSLPCSGRR